MRVSRAIIRAVEHRCSVTRRQDCQNWNLNAIGAFTAAGVRPSARQQPQRVIREDSGRNEEEVRDRIGVPRSRQVRRLHWSKDLGFGIGSRSDPNRPRFAPFPPDSSARCRQTMCSSCPPSSALRCYRNGSRIRVRSSVALDGRRMTGMLGNHCPHLEANRC